MLYLLGVGQKFKFLIKGLNLYKGNDFGDRLITFLQGSEWYLIVTGSVFRIWLTFALYYELDVLLLLIWILSLLLSAEAL